MPVFTAFVYQFPHRRCLLLILHAASSGTGGRSAAVIGEWGAADGMHDHLGSRTLHLPGLCSWHRRRSIDSDGLECCLIPFDQAQRGHEGNVVSSSAIRLYAAHLLPHMRI